MEWGTVGEWVSGIGTLTAVMAALWIAHKDWRRADLDRRDREAGQARLVMTELAYPGDLVVLVNNLSDHPILDVQLVMVRRQRPEGHGWRTNPRVANNTPFRESIGPHSQHRFPVDILDLSGAKVHATPSDSYFVTFRFMDADGIRWTRTNNDPPERDFEPTRRRWPPHWWPLWLPRPVAWVKQRRQDKKNRDYAAAIEKMKRVEEGGTPTDLERSVCRTVAAIERTAERRGPRDNAIIRLFLYCGPQVQELARLDIDDIRITARTGRVRLHGKGDEVRDVPVPSVAREAVSAWLLVRGSEPGPLLTGGRRWRPDYRGVDPGRPRRGSSRRNRRAPAADPAARLRDTAGDAERARSACGRQYA